MVDINATLLPILEPFAMTFQGIIGYIQIVVGGIFGLYVILLLLRLYTYFKFDKYFKRIEKSIHKLDGRMSVIEKKLGAGRKRKKQ